jgi:hypothetical protein
MPRRRRHSSRRSRRNAGRWVSFTTRRGKRVRFRRFGPGHKSRRSTRHLSPWKKAMSVCAHKPRGPKPGTKAFGKCMRAYVRSHGGSRRRRSRR